MGFESKESDFVGAAVQNHQANAFDANIPARHSKSSGIKHIKEKFHLQNFIRSGQAKF